MPEKKCCQSCSRKRKQLLWQWWKNWKTLFLVHDVVRSWPLMYQSSRSFNILPGHLSSFLVWEGGNLITTHTGWGIWSLAAMSCYKINRGGDCGDVKLWWIQRKKLHICGRFVENQRPTQAVFRIWRAFKTDLFLLYVNTCCLINHVYMHSFRSVLEATEKLKQ